jgi:hypothetical protein
MRIGNNELNENESEWAKNFAENIANQACKQTISALNIKCSQDDVKALLAWLWSKKSEPVVEDLPEPEEFEDEEDE